MSSGVTDQQRHNIKKHLVKVLSEIVPQNKVQWMMKIADSIENKAYSMAPDVTKYQGFVQSQLDNFRAKWHQVQSSQNMNGHVPHPMQNTQAFPPGAGQAHPQANPHVGMQQPHAQQLQYPGYPNPMAAQRQAPPQGNQDADFSSFLNDVGLLNRPNDDKSQVHGQQHDMMVDKQMAVNALQNPNAAANYRGQMQQGAMMPQQQQPGMMPGPGPAAASMYLPQGMQQRTGVAPHGLMGLQPQQGMPYPIPTGMPPVRMTANPAAQAPQLPNPHQMMNPGLAGVHQAGMTQAQAQQQQQQINAIAAQNAIVQQQQNNAAVAAMNNAAKNSSMMGMAMNNGMTGGFGQAGSQMQQFHMSQQPQQQQNQQQQAVQQQNAVVQSGRVGPQMQSVPQNAGPGNMIPLNALNAPNNLAAPRTQHPAQMNNPAQPMPNMAAPPVANPNQPMPASNNPAAQQALQVPTNPAEIRERLLPTYRLLIERGDAVYAETSRLLSHHLEMSRRQLQAHPNNTSLAGRHKRLEQAQKIMQHFSKVSAEWKAGNANITQKTTYQLNHVIKNVENLAKQLTSAPTPPTPPTQQVDNPKPPASSNAMPTPAQAATPASMDNQEKGEVIDLTEHRHDNNPAAAAMHAAAAHATPNSLPANANSPAVLAAPSPHAASPIPLSQAAAQRPSIPRAPESHTPANANFPLPPKASSMSVLQAALSTQVSTPAADTAAQADTPVATMSAPATEPAASALDPMALLQQQLDALSSGTTPSLDAVRAQQYIKAAVQQSYVVPIDPSTISSQLKLDEFTAPRLHSCNIATYTADNMQYLGEDSNVEAGELSSGAVQAVLQPEYNEQLHSSRKRARMAVEEECSGADGQLPEGARVSLHPPEGADVPFAADTAVVVEVEVVEDGDKMDATEEERSWKRLKLAVPTEYPDEPPQALFPSQPTSVPQTQYQVAIKQFQASLEERHSLSVPDMAAMWLDSVRTSCRQATMVS